MESRIGVVIMMVAWMSISVVMSKTPHCTMYGICSKTPVPGTDTFKYAPCINDTEPLPLMDQEAVEMLREMCPMFAPKDVEHPKVCCNRDQVHILYMGMTIPKQVLGRCPSCLQSFVRFWCQQACAPDESDYLQPHHIDYEVSPQAVFHADEPRRPDNYISSSTYINLSNDGVIESNNGTTASPIVTTAKYGSVVEFEPVNGTSLTTLDFYLSEVYLNKLWQSCKNVQYSAAQTPAVQMMCGSKGVNCTGKDWIGYMGDPAVNPYVPFKVNWKYVSDGEHKLLNATQNAIPCNQPVDDSSAACSCQDCHAACGPDIPYPSADPVQCYFAGVDCYTFLSLFVFSGFTFILFVMFILQFLVDSNSIFKYASSSTDDIPSYKGAPGTLDETEISYRERFGHHFERQMEKTCVKWGHICYRHPIMVFIFGLSVSLVLSSGCVWLRFTTDPVELWSAPGSRARNEKDFFDENFGPFFRTEQLIVKPVNQEFISVIDPESFDEVWLGPVFNETLLERVLILQNTLVNITGQVMLTDANGTEYMHTVRLGDICFKPMAPDHDDCTIQSALNWFQNNVSALRLTGGDWGDIDFRNHMRSCIDAPTLIDDALPLHLSCLGTYGGPIFPYVALGGFNKSDDYMTARALVITFVVVNSQQPEHVAKAEAWEQEFITYLTNFTSPDFNVSFMAERSIQDEIKRQSHSDVLTIVVSYLFMFGYIAFALGQYNVDGDNLCSLLVHSKVMLGVAGVVIVALSVTSSIGVYAWCGIPATMIILEVQPFLVLAVGVDNIFIFVQAYQRDRSSRTENLETRIGRISGEVIPSMLLSSIAEICCFFLGAISSMPAVKVFSLYAGMAIFFDFFLQVTCFLSLFTLDLRRQEAGRLEIACCARVTPREYDNDGMLYSIFKRFYTPFILSKHLAIFVAWACSSLAVIDKIELGLDSKVSMPDDSYVLDYFNNMEAYLSVGPPVYFVVKGPINYADYNVQNAICGSAGCRPDSLSQQIYSAARYKNDSKLAHPVMNWLDDYFDWIRPNGDPACCRQFDNGTFCPATINVNSSVCHKCDVSFTHGRPVSDDFRTFLPDFLSDNPNRKCSKGGHAAYGHALRLTTDKRNRSDVVASHFMTYHTPLKTSADFITALQQARFVADNITTVMRDAAVQMKMDPKLVHVYPYSMFYVFYEQYTDIAYSALLEVLLSISVIFLVTSVFLGFDPWAALMIVVTLALILINLMGLMYWWRIDFNAISLVNLVMAVGISVEFCSHTVRAFTLSIQQSRVERAREALATMGSSVLSGITLTKFGGIIVLAFAHSKIFQVYYFRMYLGIVLYGAAHGLVFLPVLLSFAGPPVNKRRLLAWSKDEMNLGEVRSIGGAAHDQSSDNDTNEEAQLRAALVSAEGVHSSGSSASGTGQSDEDGHDNVQDHQMQHHVQLVHNAQNSATGAV